MESRGLRRLAATKSKEPAKLANPKVRKRAADPDEDEGLIEISASKRQKTPAHDLSSKSTPIAAKERHLDDMLSVEESKKSRTPKPATEGDEKRLRRWRTHAPKSYLDRLQRAMSQRCKHTLE